MRATYLVILSAALVPCAQGATFSLEEATIAGIHQEISSKRLTSEQLLRQYLLRIKAYNGTCVREPEGILGPVTTVPNAGQINALSTLNLRPATRRAMGFDDRKARSLTDALDNDAAMPDALEVAKALDRGFAASGKLAGPLHGIPIAIKDQFDTFDMRTTSGADAAYANDRPKVDATIVQRLREAGAIIIGKANMGEYAGGDRSAFGGTSCNPYDTERSPGRSSGGSGAVVAANLAVCAIGEESGPSVRNPAKNNNVVGLAPTQELVSRAGMIPASFMNDRVGPMCRGVADVAKVLDVIHGFDAKDELTAFAVGRAPSQPFAASARPGNLKGLRIGVLREYMDGKLFTAADSESIAIVERALPVLESLGAELVDPKPAGLFDSCVRRYVPSAHNELFTRQFPERFAVDAAGKPAADHMPVLVGMFFDTSRFPDSISIRGLGAEPTTGEGRYVLDRYLQQRGDANIRSTKDLIAKSVFYTDVRAGSGFSDKRSSLESKQKDLTLDVGNKLRTRFALQQIVLQCMAEMKLDAVTYPTGNVPAPKLGAPTEPTVNGRSALAWTLLGANGFPAISVPAGFTTQVYDRVPDSAAPGGTRLAAPVAAELPVGIDFLGRPFSEPTLLRIAAAYEGATHHRRPPRGFGPLPAQTK
jgi:amidase